jgi:dethiobiotin synthetase
MLLKNTKQERLSRNAMACKPIQTGSLNGKSQDLDFILKTAGISVSDEIYEKLVSCTFKTPASPLLASQIENKKINLDEIVEKIREISKNYDLFFVETAGGIYSPITETGATGASETNADFAKKLGFPVIICIPNRVGAISLSVMTVKSVIAEGLKIEGAVFSQTIKPQNETDEMICKDNVETFKRMTGVKIIADIKFGEENG